MSRPRQKKPRGRGKGPISSQTPEQRRERRIRLLKYVADRTVAAAARAFAGHPSGLRPLRRHPELWGS